MHIANQIRQEGYPCEILFMTGHLEYIQQAFEVQAYKFIQKPGWEALEKNIVKISNDWVKHQQRKTLSIKCGSEVFFIIHDDICYIEHIGAKTIVCTKNGLFQT